MEKGAGWLYLTLFCIWALYCGWAKPECKLGFVPTMGFGTGWYCSPGYKPA